MLEDKQITPIMFLNRMVCDRICTDMESYDDIFEDCADCVEDDEDFSDDNDDDEVGNQAKSAELETVVLCVVCQVLHPNIVMLPCKHMKVCSECNIKLQAQSVADGEDNYKCPCCREIVADTLQVLSKSLSKAMSFKELNQEFHDHLEDIMYSTVNINDPYDRVTIMQWIRKLQSLDEQTLAVVKSRNQYANYLRITLANRVVHLSEPFKEPPPENNLRPLCEVLANSIATKCPPIPMTGPIEPVMSQVSEDGRVVMSVKQSPDGGIFCYMAVTPDEFKESN